MKIALLWSLSFAAAHLSAQSQGALETDIRDLAAALLFNGVDGARAYDVSGPIGDDDAMWVRPEPGRYVFTSSRSGTTLQGGKTVSVASGCRLEIETRIHWHFAKRYTESLERIEEFDFSLPVVADVVLAEQDGKPVAVILDLRSVDGFYCAATRINGSQVQSRQCRPTAQFVVGPGRADSPVLQRFHHLSDACKALRSRG